MDALVTFILSLIALAALGRVAATAGRALGLSPRIVSLLQSVALG